MSKPLSARLFATSTILLTILVSIILHACRDEPTAPETPAVEEAQGNSPNHRQLTVNGTGSTVGGTITSSRGNISCTVNVSTSGVVSLSGTCSRSLRLGMVITLTAKPVGNNVLARWVGCVAAPENPYTCQVTMDQNRTISAVFAPPPNTYNLRVSGGASGSGRVVSSP